VATGDRVLLPEYGGQNVKLNDTECAPGRTTHTLRTVRAQRAHSSRFRVSLACALSLSCLRFRFRRFVLYRDEEILGVLKDE
jgi:hypothetical protein